MDEPSNLVEKEGKDVSKNDDKNNGKQCLVCIEEIKDECILNPCGHSYCYPCILDWMKQKQRCPLCNIDAVELIRCDANAEAGTLITKVSDIADSAALQKMKSSSESEGEVVETFECLDHSYLKNEVDKLLYKLEYVQTKMKQNSQKYNDFQWFVSEQIDDQIYDLENIVEEFRDFNPSEIASRCILLEEHLDAIRNNKWDDIEEYYSDLYDIELQKQEEVVITYQSATHKNHSKKNGNNNLKNNKGSSNYQRNDYEEDDYYHSNFDAATEFGDYSIKSIKPKAPKKNKINSVTVASLSQTNVRPQQTQNI